MELEQNELKMLDLLRNLNKEGQDAALAMLSGFAGQDIYKKGDLDAPGEMVGYHDADHQIFLTLIRQYDIIKPVNGRSNELGYAG